MPEESKQRNAHCHVRQELMAAVQEQLVEISRLTQEAAAALAVGHENTAAKFDELLETAVGEKERAMGALHQHREEHGC
jgi:hypothetical protein